MMATTQPAFDPDPADRIEADMAAIAAAIPRRPSNQDDGRTLDALITGGFNVTVVGYPDPTRQEGTPHYSVILEMAGLPRPSKVTLHGTGPTLDHAVRDALSIGDKLQAVATLPVLNPFASGCRAPVIRSIAAE